ncbi:branched-chain amino acid ABC transporter permease [Bacillus sp. UNC41MFS5]|uniref:branched-chain amino acid ABC transporter permease n=1 Tax=Bacillus sp. UNC41MFS5 TaxID=1449046 RepID=UPI00068AC9A0|nr:branched-chain amino acid ABC transporter permease [Bacillus sp. UNC41MFS5]
MGIQAEKVVTEKDQMNKTHTLGDKTISHSKKNTLFSHISQPKIYVPLFGLLFVCVAPLTVNEYYQNILNSILLFAIAGVSWNIFGGYARQVSIGHALFFGIGAYTSTILLTKYGISPWIGMFVGGIISVVVGYIMGMGLMRLRGHYFAIATIVFSQVALLLVTKYRGFTGGAEGLSVPFAESFGMLQFSSKLPYFYIFLAFLVVILLLVRKIENSRLGYYMIAMGQDDQAAKAIGINIPRVKHIALAISAFTMSMVGTLYAQYMYFIEPKAVFDVPLSVEFAMVSIIGGLGTVMGPVIGAIVMKPFIEVAISITSFLGLGSLEGINYFLYGIILIVVVILIPNGLIRPISKAYNRLLSVLPGGKSKWRDNHR